MSSQSAYASSQSYTRGQQVIGSTGKVYAAQKFVPPGNPPPSSGSNAFWAIVAVIMPNGIPSIEDVPDGYSLQVVGGVLVWAEGGGGGSSGDTALLFAGLAIPGPVGGQLQFGIPFYVDLTGVNALLPQGLLEYSEVSGTIPPVTCEADSVALSWENVNLSFVGDGLNTPNDSFVLSATVNVTNLDGTEQIVLLCQVLIAQGLTDQTEIEIPDMTATTGWTVSNQVGDDLVYDPDAGTVTTTAGGTYYTVFDIAALWT